MTLYILLYTDTPHTTHTLFSSTVQFYTHTLWCNLYLMSYFDFCLFWKLFNTAEKKHTHHYLVKLQIKQVMISFSFFSLYYYLSFTKQNMYIIYIYIYLSSCLFIIFWNCIIMIRSGVIYCFLFFLLYLYFVIAAPLHSRHFPSTIPFCFCFSLIYYNQYSLWFFFVLPSSSFSRLSHRAYFHVSSLL